MVLHSLSQPFKSYCQSNACRRPDPPPARPISNNPARIVRRWYGYVIGLSGRRQAGFGQSDPVTGAQRQNVVIKVVTGIMQCAWASAMVR